MSSSPEKGIDPIVWESLRHVVAAEKVESHDRVERLEKAVLAGRLGVAGYDATAAAIQGDYADVLIIDQCTSTMWRCARNWCDSLRTTGSKSRQ